MSSVIIAVSNQVTCNSSSKDKLQMTCFIARIIKAFGHICQIHINGSRSYLLAFKFHHD